MTVLTAGLEDALSVVEFRDIADIRVAMSFFETLYTFRTIDNKVSFKNIYTKEISKLNHLPFLGIKIYLKEQIFETRLLENITYKIV